MKILYHHRIQSKDGQYVHVEELINAFERAGHAITIVGPRAIEENHFGADAGFVAKLKKSLPGVLYELLEFGYSFFDFFRLASEIIRNRPDCIYERYNLYLPSGVVASRVFGLPLALEVNAPLFDERSKFGGLSLKRFAKAIENFTWRNANFVLPVTKVLARTVQSVGVEKRRIHVVPNGVRLEDYAQLPARVEAKKALGLDNRFVLGFTGFVREWHGLDRVLDYLAHEGLTDQQLLIVGDGPAVNGLWAKADDLGIAEQLTVTGIIERKDITTCLSAFDIALQPAVVEYASPLKLFEYLAIGHSIVAPSSPNIREILENGENALLFEEGNDSEFFRCIERIRQDSAVREKIRIGASKTIVQQGLTWDRNAERVIELFSQTLQSEQRSRIFPTGEQ